MNKSRRRINSRAGVLRGYNGPDYDPRETEPPINYLRRTHKSRHMRHHEGIPIPKPYKN
ncbi:hypothetical protein TcWFU_008655 [Taenia crassiceps]|uniref:Uncharacterized protein n=1 Tax=Taenia crassiceps TaxID=6207 RepID=A0ABR4QSU6_9CEST